MPNEIKEEQFRFRHEYRVETADVIHWIALQIAQQLSIEDARAGRMGSEMRASLGTRKRCLDAFKNAVRVHGIPGYGTAAGCRWMHFTQAERQRCRDAAREFYARVFSKP